MPMPASLTAMTMLSPARSSFTCTRPCLGVNLIAFETRFQMTWRSRPESPEIGPASLSKTSSTLISLAWAGGGQRCHRGFEHRLRLDGADVQTQLARDNARDVEQIADDPVLRARAAFD